MSKTSSGMEQPSGFDLPPMPVPYEGELSERLELQECSVES